MNQRGRISYNRRRNPYLGGVVVMHRISEENSQGKRTVDHMYNVTSYSHVGYLIAL